jgi:hypothetical protein
MTKKELIAALVAIAKNQEDDDDYETDHEAADDLLLQYIADKDVDAAFNGIIKWYC